MNCDNHVVLYLPIAVAGIVSIFPHFHWVVNIAFKDYVDVCRLLGNENESRCCTDWISSRIHKLHPSLLKLSFAEENDYGSIRNNYRCVRGVCPIYCGAMNEEFGSIALLKVSTAATFVG